jgi:hypothetical protein
MTDYEEKYKAFRIDDTMKRKYANYVVGVDMLSPAGELPIETILIEESKKSITPEEA